MFLEDILSLKYISFVFIVTIYDLRYWPGLREGYWGVGGSASPYLGQSLGTFKKKSVMILKKNQFD